MQVELSKNDAEEVMHALEKEAYHREDPEPLLDLAFREFELPMMLEDTDCRSGEPTPHEAVEHALLNSGAGEVEYSDNGFAFLESVTARVPEVENVAEMHNRVVELSVPVMKLGWIPKDYREGEIVFVPDAC